MLEGALLPKDATGKRTRLKLWVPTAKEVKHYYSPDEAASFCQNDMTILCLPHAKNEPAIDALSSDCLFWQASLPSSFCSSSF